jgi:hypothetical protein
VFCKLNVVCLDLDSQLTIAYVLLKISEGTGWECKGYQNWEYNKMDNCNLIMKLR